jgi:hypothetical protein
MITKYTGQNTYVYYYNSTNKKDEQNITDVQFAKHSVYPAAEIRNSFGSGWATKCNTEDAAASLSIGSYRYPVNLAIGVRCVKIQ